MGIVEMKSQLVPPARHLWRWPFPRYVMFPQLADVRKRHSSVLNLHSKFIITALPNTTVVTTICKTTEAFARPLRTVYFNSTELCNPRNNIHLNVSVDYRLGNPNGKSLTLASIVLNTGTTSENIQDYSKRNYQKQK